MAALALAALVALTIFKLASEIGEGELNAFDTPGLDWVRAVFGDVATLTLVVAFSAGLLATLGRRRLAAFQSGIEPPP